MHIVWDWNGTLLADLPVVIDSVNVGIQPYWDAGVTLDQYRDHYTRPVRHFYDLLLGRRVTDDEWHDIDRRFHDAYNTMMHRAELAGDAVLALESVAGSKDSQSLLSMFPHDELLPLVDDWGISGYFQRVDGLRGVAGDRKAGYLKAHLAAMDVAPSETVMIGDTPDDAHAASAVGAGCVLIDGGAHHHRELVSTGVPVVSSLLEALSVIE